MQVTARKLKHKWTHKKKKNRRGKTLYAMKKFKIVEYKTT